MLASILEYHAVVEAMTQNCQKGLHDFELLDEDWDIITQLKEVLEVFKQATLLFSVKDTANLVNVIPMMDSIDSVLEVGMGTKKYHNSIHLGLALAQWTLNCYYSKTDASDAYRVAMLLHLRYKSTYSKDHDWEPEWITASVNIMHGIY
ncbi:hypothetical protein BS47DRAFT_1263363, partial [Hydnum rufescens UP504]